MAFLAHHTIYKVDRIPYCTALVETKNPIPNANHRSQYLVQTRTNYARTHLDSISRRWLF